MDVNKALESAMAEKAREIYDADKATECMNAMIDAAQECDANILELFKASQAIYLTTREMLNARAADAGVSDGMKNVLGE